MVESKKRKEKRKKEIDTKEQRVEIMTLIEQRKLSEMNRNSHRSMLQSLKGIQESSVESATSFNRYQFTMGKRDVDPTSI